MSHDAVKRVGKNPNFIKIIAKVLTTPLAMLKFVLPVYHLIVAAGYIFYLVSKKDYEEYMGTVTTEIKKKI